MIKKIKDTSTVVIPEKKIDQIKVTSFTVDFVNDNFCVQFENGSDLNGSFLASSHKALRVSKEKDEELWFKLSKAKGNATPLLDRIKEFVWTNVSTQVDIEEE